MTESEIKAALKEFFVLLLTWIEDQEHNPCFNTYQFRTYLGICTNLEQYLFFGSSIKTGGLPMYMHTELFKERTFPFNVSAMEFYEEAENLTLYVNPNRLAFIKEWATKEIL